VRAASTASSSHAIDDSMRRSCRGFPARTRNSACGNSRRGSPPALRLAYVGNECAKAPDATGAANAANAANAAGGFADASVKHFPPLREARPPNVYDNIRQQCEAFLRDFNGCTEVAAACVPVLVEENAHRRRSNSVRAARVKTEVVNSPDPGTGWMRRALRRLLLTPDSRAEVEALHLHAFCGFLQALIDARPAAQPSLVCAFCRSESSATARAIEFSRNYFDRLQRIPEVAAQSAGDVVFLLLGCLAGKGINEIWSHEAMQALPIAHLAILNALASAAAKEPKAVKRCVA
jgi:hypothetical protein